ncbi:MAG TPA: hypothetical protein VGM10_01090, partial [Actinocrinis sp.]
KPAPDEADAVAPIALRRRSNGYAGPGLVLAILVWPVGLVLSVIALVRSRSCGGEGRTTAILGLLCGVVLGVVTFVLVSSLRIAPAPPDPGCAAAKAPATVIQDASVDSAKLDNAATQIHNAAGKAKNPQLKVTLNAIYSDTLLYIQQLQSYTTTLVPAQQLQQNLDDLDRFCQFPSP